MEDLVQKSDKKRIVIVGGGFGGLRLAQDLAGSDYQVVLVDQNNYHQFQPLFYQVATSGLESSSIVFPFRKIFHKAKNVHFRLAKVDEIHPECKVIHTNIGSMAYDYLVLATGAGNNFFGNEMIEKHAHPMKNLVESLELRNTILKRFEEALNSSAEEREALMNFIVVGGGPTGTELAGALAEMKHNILPKDYPELDFSKMKITIVEGANRVLGAMDEKLSQKVQTYLKDLGVALKLNSFVANYDGTTISLKNGETFQAKTVIWSAGIKGNTIKGLEKVELLPGNRILVNGYNEIIRYPDHYALGDVAIMINEHNPKGHPQMAQPAIQQGRNLANNFKARLKGKKEKEFIYKNLGSMATVGRNKAVVQLPNAKFGGFAAWFVWMFIHLRSIFGIKNKWIIFINWVWNYFTYNSSLRLIIERLK
jgi:NADH:ubiquinone reductase (H+-translocating)